MVSVARVSRFGIGTTAPCDEYIALQFKFQDKNFIP